MKCINLTHLLSKRERTGGYSKRKILQTCFQSRTYKLNAVKRNAGVVKYDGYLYLQNHLLWLCRCMKNGRIHLMETKINTLNPRKLKIKDSLTYFSSYSSLHDTVGLNNGIYTHCIYVLTDHSLRRYNFHYLSGEWNLSKEIKFLSRYKFQTITHMREDDIFVLKSKKHVKRSQNKNITFYYFALFNITPFSLISIFTISSSLFHGLQDAYIYDDFLVVTYSKKLRFYALEEVYSNSAICDQTETFCESVVNKIPSCLLTIPTKDLMGISIGGFPWSCVIHDNDREFKIYRLPCMKKMTSMIMEQEDGLDRREFSFHSDRSNRLVCVDLNSIKVFKLNHNEPYITDDFRFSFYVPEIREESTVTSSGRHVKRYKDPSCADVLCDVVHSFSYNFELDVISVLYTKIEAPSSFMISIFSNQDGAPLKHFPIDNLKISDSYEWEIIFEDMMIIIILKHLIQHSQTACFFYSLT